jgi:hypothetical protein
MKLPALPSLASIRRRFDPKPATTLSVTDGEVDCPQVVQGVGQLDRCMTCDRLVVLHVDAHGDGTIDCHPGQDARPG